MKKEISKKEALIAAKYVHVTLHKLINKSLDYWVEKGMRFRNNTVACLVGLEENKEEEKGLHAHIVIQFSTRQQLFRRNFVQYFGTDSLHISTPSNKDGLLNILGYAAKTNHMAQRGTFTHRGIGLDTNPEVYRFQHQVKTKDDAIHYFQKVIKENIDKSKNIIKEYAKRDDAIGRYLVGNTVLTKALHKLAYTWHLDYTNEKKQGFVFTSFVESKYELSKAYKAYLKEFPGLFKKNKKPGSKLILETDYNRHEGHDLEVLQQLMLHLRLALKYGHQRPHKYLNLYLWSSKPSFGKTTLLDFLDDHMMAYRLPDDQYYVDYENGLYQVLVSDEAAAFIKTKDYSHLKHILEGKKVEFNLKGREKIYKEDNPLIVLAENISFDELMTKYHKGRYDHDIMQTRVLDLELKSRATLHFFLDRCINPGMSEQLKLTLGKEAIKGTKTSPEAQKG